MFKLFPCLLNDKINVMYFLKQNHKISALNPVPFLSLYGGSYSATQI